MAFKFDTIVALGKNWKKYPPKGSSDFNLELSEESKITVLAAGELYLTKVAPMIIFSSGKTAGQRFPSEASKMYEYMKSKYPEIPDDGVVLEERSLTTFENAKEVKSLMRAMNRNTAALLTIGFHLPRAVKVFRDHRMDVSGFASERVLTENSEKYKAFVGRYLSSRSHVWEAVKEWLWRSLLFLGLLNLPLFRTMSHNVRERD